MIVSFTKFRNSKGLLTKTAKLEAGKLVRQGATQLAQGHFETQRVEWSKFGDFLLSLQHNEAISLGTVNNGLKGGPVKSRRSSGPGTTRTLDNFSWGARGNLAFLDFDELETTSTMEEELSNLTTLCPELKHLSYWLYPSSSSYLSYEGGGTGLKGFHAYTWLPSCAPPELLKQYLTTMLQGSGKESYVISKGVYPRVLVRYPVDMSVFSPERLVYSAGSHCAEGVSQDRGSPVFVPAQTAQKPVFSLPTDVIRGAAELAQVEKAKFARESNLRGLRAGAREVRAKDVSIKAARTQEKYFERNEVPGSLAVLMDSGEWVKAWKFLLYPLDWNQKTCHDPFEPDYGGGAPNKAIVFSGVDPGMSASIVSHAHGTHTYRVVFDQESIMEALNTMSTADLEEQLGEEWVAKVYTQDSISDTERSELLTPLQQKTGLLKVAELKEKIASGVSEAQRSRLEERLRGYNSKYASVEMGGGGGFRVVRPVISDSGVAQFREQKKQDFLDAVAGDKVVVWVGTKPKMVSLGKLWLEWKDRNHYHGTTFDPDGGQREIIRANGERILNLFQGFTVGPEEGRVCGKKEVGCFSCFFNELDYSICPYQMEARIGVTYWLRHIFECVCLFDKKTTRWVVDWICDIVRNPGGGRPGTALVVHGEEKGTGKGATIWPVMKILGGAALHTSNTDHIVGHFNSQLEQTILVFGDEATWSKGKAASSALKYLVTEPRINIERKGLDVYTVRNLLRLFVSSNNERAIPAELGERRYATFEISPTKKGQLEGWFNRFLHPSLLGVYLSEMTNFERVSDLRTIPNTDALQLQKELATESRAEYVFIEWAFDEHFLWDKHGNGLEVDNNILKAIFKESGALDVPHEGSVRLTHQQLLRRVKKILIERMGGLTWRTARARGIQMPPLVDCINSWERIYGADAGSLRYKYLD